MKQITLDVAAATEFFGDLHKALKPLGLEAMVFTEGLTPRDLRTAAEVLREVVLLSEEKRIEKGRKKSDA